MPRVLIATIVTIIFTTGCTQVSKERDTSSTSDTGQKTAASSARSGPKAQTACEVLTASDIAGVLKAHEVKKNESGKNELTKIDYCYWNVNGSTNKDRDERIEVTLRRAESADEGSLLLLFSAAKGDAVEHDIARDRAAQPVPGVGDEAIYSPFPDGGSIALRAVTSAVTISGLLSKDALVSMAKLVAQKL